MVHVTEDLNIALTNNYIGEDQNLEGWILVEFWKPNGIDEFVEFANKKWQEYLANPDLGEFWYLKEENWF